MKSTSNGLLLFFLVLCSCSHPNSNHLNSIDPKFKKYLTSLNYIHLPFKYELESFSLRDSSFLNSSPHFDTAGFSKYGIKGCIRPLGMIGCVRPLGIIFNDRDNTLLADISFGDYSHLNLSLTSFDKQGNKIDSITPYQLYQQAKYDTTLTTIICYRITKDKRITIIDTFDKWKLKPNGKMLAGSEMKSVDSTVYLLSLKGKFLKLRR